MLVDSHCHLDFPDFAEDLDAIVARAEAAGIGRIVTISTRVKRLPALLEIAERFPNVYCSVGTHPHQADEEDGIPASELIELTKHPKVVALGEAGLDNFYEHGSSGAQERGFRAHIAAARATDLPLVIHTREADEDCGRILEDEMAKGSFRAVLHCYTGGNRAEIPAPSPEIPPFSTVFGVRPLRVARGHPISGSRPAVGPAFARHSVRAATGGRSAGKRNRTEMQTYPLLPLRDIVVFPGMVVPLFVGREKSVAALEAAMAGTKDIFLLAQLDPGIDDPDADDLYDTGVIAKVLQLLKLPDGTVRVLVEGHQRARLMSLDAETGAHGAMLVAGIELVEAEAPTGPEISAMMRQVVEQFGEYAKLSKKLPQDAGSQLGEIDDAGKLADAVAANLAAKVSDKQSVLSQSNPLTRLEMVLSFMEGELGVLQVERKIRGRVKRQMEKTQREYYLNEQLKAIQSELGGR